MSYLCIDLEVIRKNLEDSRQNAIVCKSNFYGLGYELLNHIKDDISVVYVSNTEEYKKLAKYLDAGKDVVILYPDAQDYIHYKNSKNLFLCINSTETIKLLGEELKNYNNLIVRVDDFLGLHGIGSEELLKTEPLPGVKKILVHINEWVNNEEQKIIEDIYHYAQMNKCDFSIGGTKALKLFDKKEPIEFRYAAKLFHSDERSPVSLHANIINTWDAGRESIVVGYKSDRKEISKGFLTLIDIGYGDWPLITGIYQHKIPLRSGNNTFRIPVYPCMNTMWLVSDYPINANENISFFEKISDICEICDIMDIDFDEFTTSFNANLSRKYVKEHS